MHFDFERPSAGGARGAPGALDLRGRRGAADSPDPRAALFLDEARRIGERLVSEALWHEERCTWICETLEQLDGRWQVVLRSADYDVYEGCAGIALFLARLARVTGDETAAAAALGGLRQGLALASREDPTRRPGLFDGSLGLACVAVEIGQQFGRADLVADGEKLADVLARARGGDDGGGPEQPFDLLSGVAGDCTGFLQLGRALGRDDFVGLAVHLGNRLLDRARRSEAGFSWGVPSDALHLCGLAHGASGVVHALLELFAVTGEDNYRSASREAIRYERRWFDRRRNNWADLREVSPAELERGEPVHFPVYWCNGAIGIGLERFHAYALEGDPSLLAEGAAAIQACRTLVRTTLGDVGSAAALPDFSLCHGLSGVIELFLFAHEVTGSEHLLREARHIGARGVAASSSQGRWPCGMPDVTEVPSFMLGLAGIGASLLRLHSPRSAPTHAFLLSPCASLRP